MAGARGVGAGPWLLGRRARGPGHGGGRLRSRACADAGARPRAARVGDRGRGVRAAAQCGGACRGGSERRCTRCSCCIRMWSCGSRWARTSRRRTPPGGGSTRSPLRLLARKERLGARRRSAVTPGPVRDPASVAPGVSTLAGLEACIPRCVACPRLVRWREEVGRAEAPGVPGVDVLGTAGAGVGRSAGAAGHRGAGAGGARREPDRSRLHRGPLRGLPVRGAAPGRAGESGPERVAGRWSRAPGSVGDAVRPVRAAGQCAATGRAGPLCAVARAGAGAAATAGGARARARSPGRRSWECTRAGGVGVPRPAPRFAHGAEVSARGSAGVAGRVPREPAEHADGAADAGACSTRCCGARSLSRSDVVPCRRLAFERRNRNAPSRRRRHSPGEPKLEVCSWRLRSWVCRRRCSVRCTGSRSKELAERGIEVKVADSAAGLSVPGVAPGCASRALGCCS